MLNRQTRQPPLVPCFSKERRLFKVPTGCFLEINVQLTEAVSVHVEVEIDAHGPDRDGGAVNSVPEASERNSRGNHNVGA